MRFASVGSLGTAGLSIKLSNTAAGMSDVFVTKLT